MLLSILSDDRIPRVACWSAAASAVELEVSDLDHRNTLLDLGLVRNTIAARVWLNVFDRTPILDPHCNPNPAVRAK